MIEKVKDSIYIANDSIVVVSKKVGLLSTQQILDCNNQFSWLWLLVVLGVFIIVLYVIYKFFDLKKYKISMITEYAIENGKQIEDIERFAEILERKKTPNDNNNKQQLEVTSTDSCS